MNGWQRALLALVCGVSVASVYTAQPILEPMGGDIGVAPEHAGWIVATAQLGYSSGLILLVPLGDVIADRRKLIAGHLALIAVALVSTASAPAAWVAFSGLAATGVFAVVVQTTVAYAAAMSPPAERGRNIGVVTAGVVAGILGARVVTGTLADLWGWRSVYGVLAAASLALAALALTALPSPEGTTTGRYSESMAALGKLFAQRNFQAHSLIAFFLFASFGTLWSGYAMALTGPPWQLSESQIGLFGVAGLIGAFGAARAGRWADAGRARAVTGIALTLLLLSWAPIAQLPTSLWLLAAGVLVLDFAVQAVQVSNQHILTAAYPDRVSTVIGGYMVFYSLGSAAGAAATTAVFTAHGWAVSSLLGAGFAGGALAAWLLGARRSRPGDTDPHVMLPRPVDMPTIQGPAVRQ
ncbi:MFS transporter [Nocardia cyriacigeorgica]|uniref:MFS transporter n=1 Tax=Nocardia cyriacigeorgica TaxID=135487 RepID=UPI003EE3B5A9